MPTPLQIRVKQLIEAAYTPGFGAFAVTPADDTQLNDGTEDVLVRELFIGTGGDVSVRTANKDGSMAAATVMKNIPSGTSIFGFFMSVQQTGTTATDIVAKQ